jgi:predicted transglutaminase-like cysteine proteinase
MKQMSQMKEIIIAAVAVATLMSCQSEKDKLIDSKISTIDAKLELINLTEADFDSVLLLMNQDTLGLNFTDEEIMFMEEVNYKINRHTQLINERENWVLQK